MTPAPLPFDPIREARRQWEQRWGPDPARSMASVAALMRVQQILLAQLNDLLRPLDLTFARYEALMLLSFSSRGSMPLGKISERLQVHRASITSLVDRLEQAGYVVRRPAAGDRRATLAEITDAGRRVAGAATQLVNDAGFTIPGLSQTELEQLLVLTTKVRKCAGDFDDTASA